MVCIANCAGTQSYYWRVDPFKTRTRKRKSVTNRRTNGKNTYRNKQVGHLSFILGPRLAVLVAAALDVTKSTVANHAREEERVEPRERAAKARDKTPVQGKVEIASVMDLASLAICESVSFHTLTSPDKERKQLTPPINQNPGSIGRCEGLGVLHGLPRELGESVTEHHSSTLLLTETVLLAVGRVPDPVHKQVRHVEDGQEVAVPVVFRWVMVGEIDRAVAVAQWHTSQVPENQHEAPFLIVHVPVHFVNFYPITKLAS